MPKLGDWDGPIYGEIGVISRPDGDRVECHICGEVFHSVTGHAVGAHDVDACEYRALFGLTHADSTVSLSYAAILRKRARENAAVQNIAHAGTPPGYTPEQWSAFMKATNNQKDARRLVLGLTPNGEKLRGRKRPRAWISAMLAAKGHVVLTDDERALIGRLRAEGVSVADLMQRFGGSEATIRRIAREYREHRMLAAMPANSALIS